MNATATEYKGRRITVIDYGVLGGYLSDNGTGLFAIFVDDNSEKFVRSAKWDVQIRIGEFGMLIRALESDTVSIVDIEKERRAKSKTPKVN